MKFSKSGYIYATTSIIFPIKYYKNKIIFDIMKLVLNVGGFKYE